MFKDFFQKIKNWTVNNKKLAIITYAGCAVILIVAILLPSVFKKADESSRLSYREEKTAKGTLNAGVTVDGNIDIGTITQKLDIDISEYTGSDNMFSFGGGGGGMGMMGGMPGASSSSSDSDEEKRVLEVEEVYVSVGQSISKGDKIARLSADSVTSIRASLEEDTVSAQNTYNQTSTEQVTTDQSADSTYKINSMYGGYVQSEYNTSVEKLQANVDKAQESLDKANENLSEYRENLSEDEEKKVELEALVENAEYTLKGIDKKTELYGWLDAENYREDAQKLLDSCEDEIEELEDKIKEQETEVTELEIALGNAKKEYELGVIEAKATYDTHTLYYNNSQEILDVTKLQSALAVEMAQDDLTEAQQKLSEFDTYIVDNEIVSSCDGVISEVSISAGDELYSDSDILVINDYDKVTLTVDVEDDDIESAQLGAEAKVKIDAFSDTTFDAKVTDIGDATYDSNKGITTYEVTVTLSGELSELYPGMTAEVTFITTDAEEKE